METSQEGIVAFAAEKNIVLDKRAIELLENTDFKKIIEEWRSENPNAFVLEAKDIEAKIQRPKTEVFEAKAVVENRAFKADAKGMPKKVRFLSEYDVTGQSNSEGTVKNFLALFQKKFDLLSEMLKKRHTLQPRPISQVKKIPKNNQVDVIAMVFKKWVTKNGHIAFQIEDKEASCILLIMKTDPVLTKIAELILPDNVIGVKGVKFADEMIIAKEILFPDLPLRKTKTIPDEVSIASTSDIHMGSKLFLEKKFYDFLEWINGRIDSEKEREKVSKVKYLVISGDNCVSAGTKIICKSGEKNISEIENGENVLTHKGQFRPVVKKFKREFHGKIINLKTVGSNETLGITPEHPVLAVRTKHCQYKSSRNKGKTTICNKACIRQKYASYNRECLYKHYRNYKIEWITAGELKKQDYAIFPFPTEEKKMPAFKLSKLFKKNGIKKEGNLISLRQDRFKVKVFDKIKISKDLMRLIGYYLAEGSIKFNKKRGTVVFSFNKNEEACLKDVENIFKKTFGVKAKRNYSKIDNGCQIYVHSKIIAAFFKRFSSEKGKKLPGEFMLLPKEQQKEIVKGVWYGDGCIKKQKFALSNTSAELVAQIKILLLRLGVVPTIYKIPTAGKQGKRKNALYNVEVGGIDLERMSKILNWKHPFMKKRKRKIRQHAQLEEGFVLVPIREIKKMEYKGFVYNLQVTDDNSYTTKNIVVHNCDGLGIYPTQFNDLNIKDIGKQYEEVWRLIKEIPEYIEVFIIPGQHDAVRWADPKPAIPKEFTKDLEGYSNIHFLGSPTWLEIEGFKTLIYHGDSLHDLIDNASTLESSRPSEAMVELLKKRDLMPSYGMSHPYVPEKKDFMVIKEEPDLVYIGDMHHNNYAEYRGTKVINSGTWQAQTNYQVKLGHTPTPGIVPIVELNTGKIIETKFIKEGE
ncbi:MAG: LAGLIDADG family homing endonuclease [Candidatus ainarchaeum sp.]|nr:LAGLIDADG family homing endonuclease [Candidatus ainarchaeum sp.]